MTIKSKFVFVIVIMIYLVGVVSIDYGLSDDSSISMIIVNGLPLKKDMSDIEGTEQITLKENEKANYRLLITRKWNKYIWASRDNRELIFTQSGTFYNFVEPNGAGYIKVVKAGDKFLYMEHLTLGLKNITYWGVTEEFNLK